MPDQRVDIQIRTTADTSGVTQAEQALRKVDSAAKQVGQGTAAAGQAAKATSTEIRGLTQAGAGLNQTLSGLSQGGISGVITAFRGLSTAIKGLMASGLGLLVIPLTAAAAAFYAIGKAADNARERMLGTGERTKAIAEAMKKVAEASEQNIKKATEDAKALAEAYDRVGASIDGALSRFKQVESARAQAETSTIELQRQKALQGATTDEQREKINQEYDARIRSVASKSDASITDREFFAASQRLTESMTLRRQAESALGAAGEKVASAREAERRAQASGNMVEFARAQSAREAAEKELQVAQDRFGPQLEKANRDYANTDARLKELGFIQTSQRNQQVLGEIKATAPLGERASAARQIIPDLDTRYNALAEEERSLTPGWQTERSNQISAEMAKIAAERDAAYKAISDFAATETKARTDLERTLKNTSESSAGR